MEVDDRDLDIWNAIRDTVLSSRKMQTILSFVTTIIFAAAVPFHLAGACYAFSQGAFHGAAILLAAAMFTACAAKAGPAAKGKPARGPAVSH